MINEFEGTLALWGKNELFSTIAPDSIFTPLEIYAKCPIHT